MIRDNAPMDRPIDKATGWRSRRVRLAAIASVAGALLLTALYPSVRNWLRSEASVDASRIRIGRVTRGDLVRDVVVQGSVVAARRPTLVSPARGVVALRSKAGQVVAAGEVLASIASPELGSRLEQERSALASLTADLDRQRIVARQTAAQNEQEIGLLEVEVEAARRALARAERIREEGLLNDVEYEAAKDAAQIAELRLAQARQNATFRAEAIALEVRDRRSRVERQAFVARDLERQVEELDVRAPVDGLVSRVDVNSGDSVTAGQPILVVVDLSAFEIEVSIPESYAGELAPGTPAVIDDSGRDYEGALKSVSPEVERNRVRGVVAFTDEAPAALRQNQRLSVTLVLDTRHDTLKVPRGPFLEAGGARTAYVLEEGLAIRRPIETGGLSVTEVEIIAGLEPGDEIVISDTSRFEGAERVLVRD